MNTDALFDEYGTIDLTKLGLEPVLFPDYEKDTRKKLFIFYIKLLLTMNFFYTTLADYLYLLDFLTNLIQLIVLTRKPMRVNSTNAILTGMSINHIVMIVCVILQMVLGGSDGSVEPRVDPLMKDVAINAFRVVVFGNVLKKVLTWLPIVMAITRAIAISNPDKSKFTSAKFGFQSTLSVVVISVLIDLISFFVMTSDGLAPSKEYYQISINAIVMYDNMTLVIQTIIPAFAYPVLVIVLILNNRKAKKITSNQGNDPTTSMIIIMLIFFMIVEIPQGIGAVLSILYGNNKGIYYIGQAVIGLLNNFNVFNASIYCLICAKMTPNYKNTFFNMFRCGKKKNDQVTVSAAIATTDS